jgi:hypothetical protein
MSDTKVHELSEHSRERIKGMLKSDPALGAIRGMIYNNLQQWKMKLFEANEAKFIEDVKDLPNYTAGDAYEFMRLSPMDKEFIYEQLMEIDEVDLSDSFLLKAAEKVVKKLEAVKTKSPAQMGLLKDLQEATKEALTGMPF